MTPYYQDDHVTIYHGDCRDIVPTLGRFDLLLTDPPYGIGRDRGMGGKGYCGPLGGLAGKKRINRQYPDSWDVKPSQDAINVCVVVSRMQIIWGGNYLSDMLPQSNKWLVWDKQQTMPSYSDAELAWTSLKGNAVKIHRYCGAGLLAKEKERHHPTQKPVALIVWCIQQAKDVSTILDPFAGSGTTGRAAKDLGKTAVLIELEERYCEVAARRMEQEVLPFGKNDGKGVME
tara:strand:+ start:4190 stop:4882 length:693 start_codon:yes stop_codon:yes gene_type:complete